MSTRWVAGSVRAQAFARRRLGSAAIRQLAAAPSLAQAVTTLAGTPYGRFVPATADLAEAQHGVAEAVLWNLRVLAGWLPADGVRALRALTGWFEIANVDEHVERLAGRPAEQPFRLGVLGPASARLTATASLEQLRSVLAASAWGDPGGTTARDIALSLRVRWAHRVMSAVEPAVPWVLGGVALMLASQVAAGRPLPQHAARGVDALIGPRWAAASSLADLRKALPARAAWALDQADQPDQLWRAEAAWWRRVRDDGLALLKKPGFGPHRAVGTAVLAASDAWQVRAALAAAAAHAAGLEAEFDALA